MRRLPAPEWSIISCRIQFSRRWKCSPLSSRVDDNRSVFRLVRMASHLFVPSAPFVCSSAILSHVSCKVETGAVWLCTLQTRLCRKNIDEFFNTSMIAKLEALQLYFASNCFTCFPFILISHLLYTLKFKFHFALITTNWIAIFYDKLQLLLSENKTKTIVPFPHFKWLIKMQFYTCKKWNQYGVKFQDRAKNIKHFWYNAK